MKDGLHEPINVLLLDGWKDLCLPMLQMLEPFLAPGALVIADDTCLMPKELAPFLSYIRAPSSGYTRVAIPMDDGLELTVRG